MEGFRRRWWMSAMVSARGSCVRWSGRWRWVSARGDLVRRYTERVSAARLRRQSCSAWWNVRITSVEDRVVERAVMSGVLRRCTAEEM